MDIRRNDNQRWGVHELSPYNAEMYELNVPYTSAFAFGSKEAAPVSTLGPYTQRQANALTTDDCSRRNFDAMRSVGTMFATMFSSVALLYGRAVPPWMVGVGLAANTIAGCMNLMPRYGRLWRNEYPDDELRRLYK